MPKSSTISAKRSIITSIAVSISDITLNLIVAAITGSNVMLAQALQGSADMVTAILLLIGVKGAKRKASSDHPLGYGREVFFWTLLASIFAFMVTAGLAILNGVRQIIEQTPLTDVNLALLMLVFGLASNAYSFSVSYRRLAARRNHRSFMLYIIRSSLVETKTSLLVDFMGTASAALGLLALGLYQITGESLFDGIGAVAVGILTAIGSGFLIYNLRGFIVGQSPNHEMIERIRSAALSVSHVQSVLDLRAVMIGSNQVMAIIEVHFDDGLTTDDIERITDDVKEQVLACDQAVVQVQVEAETPDEELEDDTIQA